jgi:hypothetical protein
MTPDPSVGLRLRQSGADDAAARQRASSLVPAYPALVGRVFGNPSVPTTPGTFFSVHPVDVSGAEAESGTGVLSADTSRSFLVYVVGSQAPAAGDNLVCRFVGHRWVAERMKGGGHGPVVTIPGCPCQAIPTTLTMTSSAPLSNNQILQSATLQWGPTPPGLSPLGIGSSSFLSTTTFTDITTGDQFWYNLYCSLGYYVVTRVYAVSQYGSPYRDVVRYKWLIGFGGNTCQPFMLINGQIFPGGDPTCVVTITQ